MSHALDWLESDAVEWSARGLNRRLAPRSWLVRLSCGAPAPAHPPGAQCGASEYLSVTVLEGRTPEELLRFFNDDAHRMTWRARRPPQAQAALPCAAAAR